jgi:hypothetical protein
MVFRLRRQRGKEEPRVAGGARLLSSLRTARSTPTAKTHLATIINLKSLKKEILFNEAFPGRRTNHSCGSLLAGM